MKKSSSKKLPVILILLVGISGLLLGSFLYLRHIEAEKIEESKALSREKDLLIERIESLKNEIDEAIEKNKEEADLVSEDSGSTQDQSDREPTPDPQPSPDPEPTPDTGTTPQPSNWWSYPVNITTIPLEQVTYKSVINKAQKLPSTYSPTNLVLLTSMPGIRVTKTLYVRSMIVEALGQLGAAAKADGIDLSVISAYRSYQTQESTYQYWVNYNGGSVDAADQVSARPGHSEHQLGTVVDFSSSEIGDAIGSQFHTTAAASWLAQNAPKYGFRLSYPEGQESVTGYAYESWHWRYWGE